jgi:hypothetical protein
MSPSLDNEIRDNLASYLLREISLSDFEDWFVSASWNVVQSKNQDSIDLVYEIELLLAEFSNGDWSEEELKDNFRPLVSNISATIGNVPHVIMDSAARVEWSPISLLSFDILCEGAS